jgi:hypothetical protein
MPHSSQCLLTILEPRPTEVFAVEFDQIEGAKHGGVVAKPIPESVEYREAAFVDHDGLAVHDTRSHWQARDRVDDLREARREIVAIAGEQADAFGVAARNDAEAVVRSRESSLPLLVAVGPVEASREGWRGNSYGKTYNACSGTVGSIGPRRLMGGMASKFAGPLCYHRSTRPNRMPCGDSAESAGALTTLPPSRQGLKTNPRAFLSHWMRSWIMMVATPTVTAKAAVPARIAQTRRIRSSMMVRIIVRFRRKLGAPSTPRCKRFR